MASVRVHDSLNWNVRFSYLTKMNLLKLYYKIAKLQTKLIFIWLNIISKFRNFYPWMYLVMFFNLILCSKTYTYFKTVKWHVFPSLNRFIAHFIALEYAYFYKASFSPALAIVIHVWSGFQSYLFVWILGKRKIFNMPLNLNVNKL